MLHTQIDGPAKGPKLVLVNGLFADLQSWDGIMPFLKHFCVLRYDGRGQGQSPKPAGTYLLELQVTDLEDLLEGLGWSRVGLLGISQGGSIALEFARRNPDKAVGVVAASCCAEVDPLMHAKLNTWLQGHEKGGPAHRFDMALPWIWSQQTLSTYPEQVAHYRQRAGQHPDHAVRNLIQGAMQVNIQLEDIRPPVHLMVGKEDLLTPPFMMQRMQLRLGQSSLEYVAGAHACLLEHPESVRRSALPMLQRWTHVG